MLHFRELTKKAIVAVVVLGIFVPINRAQAITVTPQNVVTAESSIPNTTLPPSQGDPSYEYTPSSNCYGSQTHFLRGVIKDPSGQPLENARVIATALGIHTQTGIYNASRNFSISETAADGSYRICADENEWPAVFTSLNINFAYLVVTVVPPSSSTATTMATTLAKVVSNAESATDRENLCIKPNSLGTACVMNITMRPALVSGVVKQAIDQSEVLFPKSIVSLEFKLGGVKWISLGEFESNSAAWFGLAGFDMNNSYRVRIQPPMCPEELSQNCPGQGLGSVSDNFTVSVTQTNNPDTASAKWLSNDLTTRDFVIRPANFVGTLKSADGSLTIYDEVQLVGTQESPPRGQTAWIYGGKVSITLEEGVWSLVAKNAGGAIMKDTTFTVTIASSGSVSSVVKADGTTICSVAVTACGASINLPLDAPNFVGVVKDDIGNPVAGSYLSFEQYDTSRQYPWKYLPIYAQSGDPNSEWAPKPAGLIGFELPIDAVLRVSLDEPSEGDSEVTGTSYYIKTSLSNSVLKIQRCAEVTDMQVPPCSNGYYVSNLSDAANTMTTDQNGRYTFVMPTANFKGIACMPGSGSTCTPVVSGNVRLSKSMQSQCENCPTYFNWVSGTNIRNDGTYSLSVTAAGKYRVEVSNARNSDGSSNIDIANSNLDFEAITSGDTFAYYKLDASGTRTDQLLQTISVTGKGDRVLTRFATPSLVGVVQAPDGTPNRYSAVDIQQDTSTEQCPSCRGETRWSPISDDGVFSAALSTGRYILSTRPNQDLALQNFTRTEFKLSALDCNSDGSVELYTYSSTQCSGAVPLTLTNGRVLITLKGANFAGVLQNPVTNEGIPFANISVMQKVTQMGGQEMWNWSNLGTNTSSSGGFGINLSEVGSFKVVFNPPYNLQSQYSSSSVLVNVTASGGSTTATPVPDSETFSVDASGKLTVKLQRPNTSGTVSLPAGVSWPVSQNGWIGVETWSETTCGMVGCYTHSPDIQSVSTSSTGEYAMNLPVGRWRLTFNPPYGTSGVARVTRELVVTTDRHLCLFQDSTSNGTTCPVDKRIAVGELDVTLATPNYSGTVRNPGTPGSASLWTPVQFSTWNETQGFWMWTNLYASTDGQGKFGVNLTENTTYKVTFEPAWSASGVSAVSKYVRVCDGGDTVESIATETLAKSGTGCTGSGTQLRNQTIELLGSNMTGYVQDSSGNRLGNVWLGIQNCQDGTTFCTWERGVNSKFSSGSSNGTFDSRLEHTSSGAVTKYIIDVNPPWNSSTGLVRQTHTVWVRDFNSDGAADWCFDSAYTSNGTGGTCSNVYSASTPWVITMTAGNLAGKVFGPAGTTVISHAQIQVEKWAKPDWDQTNGSYGWQWANVYAGANQSGVFGLDIRVAGLYRVSVSPGWDNSSGYARRRYVIRVDSDAKWCIKSGLTSTSAQYPASTATPDDDTCVFGTDNETDSVAGFTARVSASNLTGVLYTSSTDLTSPTDLGNTTKKVGGTWIGVMKKHPQGWWEWQGGSNTSSSPSSTGRFGFNITEDGEYQLDFNSSWSGSSTDAVFKLTVTASNCSSTCELSEIVGPNVRKIDQSYVVKYLAPNFTGAVFDKEGTRAIAGSWISISNSATGEWIGGISTGWNGSNAGKFASKLDNGTYRIDVWPRWDDSSSGIRRTLTVVVANGVVTSCGPTGCSGQIDGSYSISLMTESLTGKVYYPGTADTTGDAYAGAHNGVQTVMPWAWAEALSCSDADGTTCSTYVESQSSNQQGVLKMSLQDSSNPYLVRVYPNYSLYAASPLELLVKVTSGVAEWKYRGDAAYEAGAFNPDFGHIPPNFTVTVSGVTSSRYIDLYECDSGPCTTGGTKIATVMTTLKNSTWTANFGITRTKTYRAVVITTASDNAGATKSLTFTYDSISKLFGTGSNQLTHTFTL